GARLRGAGVVVLTEDDNGGRGADVPHRWLDVAVQHQREREAAFGERPRLEPRIVDERRREPPRHLPRPPFVNAEREEEPRHGYESGTRSNSTSGGRATNPSRPKHARRRRRALR